LDRTLAAGSGRVVVVVVDDVVVDSSGNDEYHYRIQCNLQQTQNDGLQFRASEHTIPMYRVAQNKGVHCLKWLVLGEK
jgi:hypothetical protein